MILSKTDFIHYLKCPESFWLAKNEPERYPSGEFSLFLQKLINEGYEVESYVSSLFEKPVIFPDFATPEETKATVSQGGKIFLQPSFKTEKGLFARIDVLEKLANGNWHLYEVKSSTKVSTKKQHNHIYDVCFQKHVLEYNGLTVDKCSVIHINSDFVKNGEINAPDLLTRTEVTEEVEKIYSQIVNEINTALTLLQKKPDLTSCSCLRKTRSNHCETFEFFNSDLPQPTMYELKRFSEKKINAQVDLGNFGLVDLPQGFELTTGQQLQYASYVQGEPIINKVNIANTLDKLIFPLHFFDYEAFGSAIPRLDGLKPFEQIPFQVSIHTMQLDGTLSHFEYLGDELEFPSLMLEQMCSFTGLTGTFVSWHASYEIGANNRMKSWLPGYGNFLDYINTHMFDLEKIFHADYIDYRFKGSSSIKKVLPVLVPELSYSDLDVQEGTAAMDVWERLVIKNEFQDTVEETRSNLLEYCKLDTLAMVEIYKNLSSL